MAMNLDDPAFSPLARDGDQLCLPSHGGDGTFGQVIIITTNDVDALCRKFRDRGLQTPGNPNAPEGVHEGPIDQTWGTREFYVEDPTAIRCGLPSPGRRQSSALNHNARHRFGCAKLASNER